MGESWTPGIRIEEKNAWAEETAVPAFIGYTEKAINGTEDLTGKPWKITSMAEYVRYFGGMHVPKYRISVVQNDNDCYTQRPFPNLAGRNFSKPAPATVGKSFVLHTADANSWFMIKVDNDFTLYLHMVLFFANGGGPCYIVSVGNFEKAFERPALESAIRSLEKEPEPTILVIPEATNLKAEECYALQQAMAMHCGGKMKNRIAIIDVFINRYPDNSGPKADDVNHFRNGFSTDFPSFVAAYYPYLATSILSDGDITGDMIDVEEDLVPFLKLLGLGDKAIQVLASMHQEECGTSQTKISRDMHQVMLQNSAIYKHLIELIRKDLNLLPPSAAVAGVYTAVDNSHGVWKAPANVVLKSVVNPSIFMDDCGQQDLNMPADGKSINAIREFRGEGVKIWGARTYDGNSQDWRYINIRRTMIFLEESVKKIACTYVSRPNDANTWSNLKGRIEEFLCSVWKCGGLAGHISEDAFEVHVGPGDTMTDDDMREGILRITVLAAIGRPADFLEFTVQQQMQKK